MIDEFAKSKKLFEKACSMIPGGVNSPVRAFRHVGGSPLYLENASGSRIIDADGNGYIDFCQSWGPLILGHAHPQVVESVIQTAKGGLSYGACHRREVELAELILSAFEDFNRIRIMSSGTEAVMTALRLARGFTGRELVLKFEGGYHGHSDGMLVKAGSGLSTFGIASSAGIPAGVARTTLVAPLDDEDAVASLFEKHGDQIAAVIIEPLPANTGLLVQRDDFLNYVREITHQYGSLLIFDEVITGFRLHFGGYAQRIGIEPDLVTLGKVIGGGMPIGAVLGKARIMDHLSPLGSVYQAGTLSGNPLSLAAGIATLNLLKANPIYDKLESLGRCFDEILTSGDLTYVHARRVGSIVWLYLDEEPLPRRHDKISEHAVERFKNIYWKLLGDGFYLPPSAYEVLFFSAAHSTEDVETLAYSILRNLGHPLSPRSKGRS